MTAPEITRLNERLATDLGRVASGTLPRFAWQHTSTIPGAEAKIGPRWLLGEWRRPSMTPEQWAKNSGGRFPYPASGWYHPYLETALPISMEPTLELTIKAISQFRKQMSTSFENQQRETNNEIEAEMGYRWDRENHCYQRLSPEEDQSTERKEWIDFVQQSHPDFNNESKGAHTVPQFMGRKASEGFVGI
jgi:hypothetical protein